MSFEIVVRTPRRLKDVVLESITVPTKTSRDRNADSSGQQGVFLGGEEWRRIQARLMQQEEQILQLRHENATLKQTHRELEELLKQIDVAVASLARNQRRRLEEAQHVAVELALAVAERLCFASIERNAFDIAAHVKSVLDELGSTDGVTIYLHPTDRQLLEGRIQASPNILDMSHVRLADDAKLARGSCRAESNDAQLLSTIEDRLADIREHLLNALPSLEVDRRAKPNAQGEIRRYPERRETA